MRPNEVVEECGSTNDLARALGEAGCPDGTWISARRQTAGRGRQGRSWVSDEGNLFLSLVLRNVPRERWTWVPLIAALSAREAIDRLRDRPEPPLRVKWPNDLWLDGRKAGGILCEAVNAASAPFLIVGIGVNCATWPDVTDQAVSCVGVSADELRPLLVARVLEWARSLAEGTQLAAREYAQVAAFPPGTAIQWGDGEQGRVIGLGDWAELKVTDSFGRERKLLAEDVRAVRLSP